MPEIKTRNHKWEFTFNVSGAPPIESGWGKFTPMKVKVIQWADRSKIEVSGATSYGARSGRSVSYALGGYGPESAARREEPPEWLIKLIQENQMPRTEV